MTSTSIETMTGQFVDLVNPDPKTIDIRDIAWATSRMPRYVGHTVSALPYTIAQHSIFVTELTLELFKRDGVQDLKKSYFSFLNEQLSKDPVAHEECQKLLSRPANVRLLLEILMHDASEAYIVDVPTPLKEADGFKQVYLELENKMMSAIRQRFNMGNPDPHHLKVLKWADRAALTIEAHHLIRSRGENWTRLMPMDMTSMRLFKEPKEPIAVYEDFIQWFEELTTHA